MVAANIGGQRREADYSAIPRCVFTTPSVFAVGVVPSTAEADQDEAAEDTAAAALAPRALSPPALAAAGAVSWPAMAPALTTGPRRRAKRRAGCCGSRGSRRRPRADRPRADRQRADRPERQAQSGQAQSAAGPCGARLITARASLGDTTRAHLGQDDLGCLELYADAETGVLAGAVAVGPDAASWMGEVTLAIRAKISVAVLADVVHAFPTYGEALETALRELAGTGGSTVIAYQQEKGTGPLSELDMETPEGDAIEQHQEVIEDESVAGARREVPLDVNEADAAEQERAVGFDDDDYR